MTTPSSWRTRIAPTPSGYLHHGNGFNFLLTYLLARLHSGWVYLRIDDGDATRSRDEFLEDIFFTLDWLGIEPDAGPGSVSDQQRTYSQQLRQGEYRLALDQLLEAGKAYACRCSRKDIKEHSRDGLYPGTCRPLMRRSFEEPFSIRACMGAEAESVSFSSLAGAEKRLNVRQVQGDMVLWRKDDLAAYHLASVCDDEKLKITHIVRGADLLDSTAAQAWLAQSLGLSHFSSARFMHHGLVIGGDGEKLSKSAGAIALKHRRAHESSPKQYYQEFLDWVGGPKWPVGNMEELLDAFATVDTSVLDIA